MTACLRVPPALFALSIALLADAFSSLPSTTQAQTGSVPSVNEKPPAKEKIELATFGGGCFWCVEAVFENMEGVTNVVSGFSGGALANPSYKQVLTGQTGHAEVCQISFDPSKVTYLQLLEVFMKTHDPTLLNRQGVDYGPQYRSVIFTHNNQQKQQTEEFIEKLQDEKAFRKKIVTQVVTYSIFYAAEEYHQDYYRKNPAADYCRTYVRPKIAKFKKVVQEMERKANKESSVTKEKAP